MQQFTIRLKNLKRNNGKGHLQMRTFPSLPSTPYTLGWQPDSEEWPKTTLQHKETELEAEAKVKNREATSLQGARAGGEGQDSPTGASKCTGTRGASSWAAPDPRKGLRMTYIETKHH